MGTTYFFQMDGDSKNNTFFEMCPPSHFYKGIGEFRVGFWKPDGVMIEVDEPSACLTLIELEEREAEALKSCRKFLPENSNAIIGSFHKYLERVISESFPQDRNL